MKKLYLFLLALSLALSGSIGCIGGSADTPVSLSIPYGGSLTSDSRVVVVDGTSFTGGNPVGSLMTITKRQQTGNNSFSCFDDHGNNIGTVSMDQGMMSEPVLDGMLTSFTMPVCFQIDGGDEVCANSMQFGDFPYDDSGLAECAGLPAGMRCVRGAAAGIITSATKNYISSIGTKTIEHRYAAVVSGEGIERRFVREFHSIVLIGR
jgi:hypothetical protein